EAAEDLDMLVTRDGQQLGVPAERLEAADEIIRQADKPANKIPWKDDCALLGPSPVTKRGVNVPGENAKAGLISQGVGGAQIADVSVDVETGVVTLNEMVAVQDGGLIGNPKAAAS